MGREALLARLRAKVAAGRPAIGAGAGTGLSAKCAEAGGADLIIIYNSGRYRMAGRGSLAGLMPYGDANARRARAHRPGARLHRAVPLTLFLSRPRSRHDRGGHQARRPGHA